MKNLVKSFAVVFGLMAIAHGAQAKSIARTSFTSERTSIGNMKLVTVDLDDSAALRISTQELKGGLVVGKADVQVVDLKSEVYEELKSEAATLSNAEVIEEKRQIVCMMIPLFGADPLLYVAKGYDSGEFVGELREVYERGACWKHRVIKLKDSYENEIAKNLQDHLTILAKQLAN